MFATHGLWSKIGVAKEFCCEFEFIIKEKLQLLDARAEEIREIEDSEHKDALFDQLSDKYDAYSIEWPHLLRESLLLALCSSFEYHITRLADVYAEGKGSQFRASDLKDRGLKRCETLMCRVGMPQDAFGGVWKQLKCVYDIRNRIAHSGAGYNDDTRRLTKKFPDIFKKQKFEVGSKIPELIEIQENGIVHLCSLMTEALREINRGMDSPVCAK